ncbi:YlxM family DNA-binding protein [Paenibacillus sp. P26]|nr:YlxM family DNA-binding protein [Paenibacillus sp. P26]
MEDSALQKTNRINLLFDFYERLLTEKQQLFLKQYFHDDYSLGEIASEFQISRQAVYEHIKRAESVLEDYESKLQLLAKHEERQQPPSRAEPAYRRARIAGAGRSTATAFPFERTGLMA